MSKPYEHPQPSPNSNYLTDYVLSELVKYVKEDTNCSIEQAMERVYNSPLMTALQDEEGELYVQSPAYLYELMERGERGGREDKPDRVETISSAMPPLQG